mgnify:CR=1 FL=1
MKSILTSILFGIFAIVSPAAAEETKPAPKDIVDTAVAAGSFKTLAAALGAAAVRSAQPCCGGGAAAVSRRDVAALRDHQ